MTNYVRIPDSCWTTLSILELDYHSPASHEKEALLTWRGAISSLNFGDQGDGDHLESLI